MGTVGQVPIPAHVGRIATHGGTSNANRRALRGPGGSRPTRLCLMFQARTVPKPSAEIVAARKPRAKLRDLAVWSGMLLSSRRRWYLHRNQSEKHPNLPAVRRGCSIQLHLRFAVPNNAGRPQTV